MLVIEFDRAEYLLLIDLAVASTFLSPDLINPTLFCPRELRMLRPAITIVECFLPQLRVEAKAMCIIDGIAFVP